MIPILKGCSVEASPNLIEDPGSLVYSRVLLYMAVLPISFEDWFLASSEPLKTVETDL